MIDGGGKSDSDGPFTRWEVDLRLLPIVELGLGLQ